MKKSLIKIIVDVKHLLATAFVLIAAPIIHLSGLNRVDDYPNLAEIDASVSHDGIK